MNINKKFLTILIWLLFVIWISFSIYITNSWLKLDDLVKYFADNQLKLIFIALFIFSIRIFLFIPVVVIIISLWSFIQNLYLLYFISLIWTIIWIIEFYFIWLLVNSDLWWQKFVDKITPHTLKIKKNWFWYVFIWALIPVLPSDLIYMAAWFEKYDFKKYLFAWIWWSIPLVFLYSFLWGESKKIINNLYYILILFIVLYWIYFIYKKIFFNKKEL